MRHHFKVIRNSLKLSFCTPMNQTRQLSEINSEK